MKLIIDISEEDYRECKFRKDLLSLGEEPTDLTFNMRMETLIANSTPLSEELEKIKQEIQSIIALADSRGEDTKLAYQCQIAINERISELKGEKRNETDN